MAHYRHLTSVGRHGVAYRDLSGTTAPPRAEPAQPVLASRSDDHASRSVVLLISADLNLDGPCNNSMSVRLMGTGGGGSAGESPGCRAWVEGGHAGR